MNDELNNNGQQNYNNQNSNGQQNYNNQNNNEKSNYNNQDNYTQPDYNNQNNYTQPNYNMTQQNYNGQGSYIQQPTRRVDTNTIKKIIKDMIGSPIVLVAALLMLTTAFVNMISLIFTEEAVSSVTSTLGVGTDLIGEFSSFKGMITMILVIISIIAIIPMIFTGVGLLKVNMSAKADEELNHSGFSLLKTGVIIQLFYSVILSAVGMFAAFLLINNADNLPSSIIDQITKEAMYNSSDVDAGMIAEITIKIVAASLIIGLIITLVIAVFIALKSLKTINVISLAAQTGDISKKISMFIIVILYISAISSIMSFFTSIIAIEDASSVLMALVTAISGTYSMIMAIALTKYRSTIKQLNQ